MDKAAAFLFTQLGWNKDNVKTLVQATEPDASGPYNLVSWKPDPSVALEANPIYHLGLPHMRQVVIRHVREPATQRLLLEKGDIDIARYHLTVD
jgi:peptide/nickel transport system substrate-binding protein